MPNIGKQAGKSNQLCQLSVQLRQRNYHVTFVPATVACCGTSVLASPWGTSIFSWSPSANKKLEIKTLQHDQNAKRWKSKVNYLLTKANAQRKSTDYKGYQYESILEKPKTHQENIDQIGSNHFKLARPGPNNHLQTGLFLSMLSLLQQVALDPVRLHQEGLGRLFPHLRQQN